MSDDSDGLRHEDSHPEVAGSAPHQPHVYRSEELLKGTREVWIEHGTEMYRLRLTSNGKLYLTK